PKTISTRGLPLIRSRSVGNRAQGDVAPILHPVEPDPLDGMVGGRAGHLEVLGARGDPEHAPPVRDPLRSAPVDARVIHADPMRPGSFEALDRIAGARLARISVRR